MSTSTPAVRASDWSPDQYLLFADARNRPVNDLLTFLRPDYSPRRIVDLGCGPGNSTALLAIRFPGASITGVDSSPAMISKARATLPEISFAEADLRTHKPPFGTDLLFANAVFQWLRRDERIPTIARLLRTLPQQREGGNESGGVLAFQMPDNYHEPSHRLIRETAASEGPWREFFEKLSGTGSVDKLGRDDIESFAEYYDALKPHCRAVETWNTTYVHVLDGPREIVEWAKGTGLQPFLNALPADGVAREAFLAEYQRRLEKEYPPTGDGKVLLMYPRRFVVAFR
ncbi:S-adenosyl-L-methionine-dependent methyltransferase [Parathielavia appendiculata]|uniref:S-adenosyl-L-methionine-dependent methyltransferase n=1 Tax=Parathielavia appendiculata TaxID=2587402 RepID=A0AAN6Z769_9PEZI|nr:S-adenosyl-L-methionine-dependent methyltransferase [Parathielavia appendiculata]